MLVLLLGSGDKRQQGFAAVNPLRGRHHCLDSQQSWLMLENKRPQNHNQWIGSAKHGQICEGNAFEEYSGGDAVAMAAQTVVNRIPAEIPPSISNRAQDRGSIRSVLRRCGHCLQSGRGLYHLRHLQRPR